MASKDFDNLRQFILTQAIGQLARTKPGTARVQVVSVVYANINRLHAVIILVFTFAS